MTALGDVPCGTCHHCCRNEVIVLLPDEGDDITQYEHDVMETPHGNVSTLKHKPNGDCIYLDATGCSIHGRAPMICRTFDCRRWYQSHTREVRRNMISHRPATRHVFNAGRDRLHTLDATERFR